MRPTTLLTIAALSLPLQAADWKPIKLADASFRAEMPVEPKVTSKDIPGEQGTFHQDVYQCLFEGSAFSIQAFRYSKPIPETSRERILDREAAKYVAGLKGQQIKSESITIDGRPGKDVTIRISAGQGKPGFYTNRVRLVLSNQTLYHVSVISPVDRPLTDSASRFYRSFHFDPKSTVLVADETPEQALRSFLTAMATRDESTLEAVVLTTEGLDWLLTKPEQVATTRRTTSKPSIKILKAGDEFTTADGKKQLATAEDVTEARALLLPQGAPFATRLRKVDGHWKVEAQPYIDARRLDEETKSKPTTKKSKTAR